MAFLLGSYGLIRPVSESLFVKAYGAHMLAYAMMAVPLALALCIYCYGWMLSKLGGMRTLLGSLLCSICVFLWCFARIEAGDRLAVAVLYLVKEVYIVIMLEQHWSLINSTVTSSEARAFNGPISGGGCIGAIAASFFLHKFVVELGTHNFVLLGACALLPAFFFSYAAYKAAGDPRPSNAEKDGAKGHLHLSLLKESRLLLILAGIVALSQGLSTVLNLKMFHLLEQSIPDMDARTAYLGGFWTIADVLTLCAQFIAAPLLMKHLPLKYIYTGVPLVNVLVCMVLIFFPGLPAAAAGLIIFKVMDYSVFRAGKEILYIPLSYDARYRAKQVIDAFTDRLSKGVTGGIMSAAGLAFTAVSGVMYSSFGLFCSALWTWLAVRLVDYRKAHHE